SGAGPGGGAAGAPVPPAHPEGRSQMTVWEPAYVAVGSNLDDPRAQVRRAIEALRSLPATRLVLTSRLYGSRPFGPIAQADFVNAAVGLLTQLDSPSLLRELRAVEAALGRPERRQK